MIRMKNIKIVLRCITYRLQISVSRGMLSQAMDFVVLLQKRSKPWNSLNCTVSVIFVKFRFCDGNCQIFGNTLQQWMYFSMLSLIQCIIIFS